MVRVDEEKQLRYFNDFPGVRPMVFKLDISACTGTHRLLHLKVGVYDGVYVLMALRVWR